MLAPTCDPFAVSEVPRPRGCVHPAAACRTFGTGPWRNTLPRSRPSSTTPGLWLARRCGTLRPPHRTSDPRCDSARSARPPPAPSCRNIPAPAVAAPQCLLPIAGTRPTAFENVKATGVSFVESGGQEEFHAIREFQANADGLQARSDEDFGQVCEVPHVVGKIGLEAG